MLNGRVTWVFSSWLSVEPTPHKVTSNKDTPKMVCLLEGFLHWAYVEGKLRPKETPTPISGTINRQAPKEARRGRASPPIDPGRVTSKKLIQASLTR